MDFIADLHIHSHFSRATSKDCIPEELFRWACLKGITLLGTGDFTHPGWLDELSNKLYPAEEDGLYKLADDLLQNMLQKVPSKCRHDVRFIFSAEISSIYKKDGKTRKIHNLILAPSLDVAKKISSALDKIGNVRSDGRPILGLDSRILLELCLEICPQIIFIPAHIWTPHFSLFGAYSGFDRLEDCFEDLSENIFALETGLSSDPAMNWRLSALDKYMLVSNSDAHSGKNLAREGNYFCCDLSYLKIRSALMNKSSGEFKGTFEFFPEEGKYHFNGHRNCGVRLSPEETIKANGICPKCGKKITLGVMHRVNVLSDREEGVKPKDARPYDRLVPLPEILANYFGCGVNTKKVYESYLRLLHNIGPEWKILKNTTWDEIKYHSNSIIADGILRVRNGNVKIMPGFDGEYGKVEIFQKEEVINKKGSLRLFTSDNVKQKSIEDGPLLKSSTKNGSIKKFLKKKSNKATAKDKGIDKKRDQIDSHSELNSVQRMCVLDDNAAVIVQAGPGTGKTRVLTYKIAHLIHKKHIPASKIMAVTFTRKAAKQMQERLLGLLNDSALCSEICIGTFHQICLDLLKKYGAKKDFKLFEPYECTSIIELILKKKFASLKYKPSHLLKKISLYKTGSESLLFKDSKEEEVFVQITEAYKDGLLHYNAFDYDDLIINTISLIKEKESQKEPIQALFSHILVDEFQDIDPSQYNLILLLAEKGASLFVIGDPDQSIYKFRGADPEVFFKFKEDFKEVKLYNLEKNYRSSSNILSTATFIIKNNKKRGAYILKAVKQKGAAIRIFSSLSEKAEGIAITEEIQNLMGGISMLTAHGQSVANKKENIGNVAWGDFFEESGQYSFSDFAVLFRVSKQADILEDCFIRAGIPYRLVGKKSLLENKSVKQILSFLKLLYDPENTHALLQLIDLPQFSELKEADKKEPYLIEDGADKNVELANKLSSLLVRYQKQLLDIRPAKAIEFIITEFGLEDDALSYLMQLAEGYSTIDLFLNKALLYREGDFEWAGKANVSRSEVVSLMTLHAAKGLEFPVVFICGLEDGILPFKRENTDYKFDIEEERRLFYVGITRAQNILYLLHSNTRRIWGRVSTQKPSVFLKEIPPNFCQLAQLKKKSIIKKPKQLTLW